MPRHPTRIAVRRVDQVEAGIDEGIQQTNEIASSTVQPKTLPPKAGGRSSVRSGQGAQGHRVILCERPARLDGLLNTSQLHVYHRAMPVVLRYKDFRFFFYSNEGSPREPVHVHVRGGGGEAKFWVQPEVRVANGTGFDARTLRELARVVVQNTELIERAWNEYFA